MSETIIVALLSLTGTAIGSVVGIITSQRLTEYRLKQLEDLLPKGAGRPGCSGISCTPIPWTVTLIWRVFCQFAQLCQCTQGDAQSSMTNTGGGC